MKFYLLALFIVATAPAVAADLSPEAVAAIFEEGENQRPEITKSAQQELVQLKQRLAIIKSRTPVEDGGEEFRTPAEREKAIAGIGKKIESQQQYIERLRDKRIPIIPKLRSVSVGQVGRVAYVAKIRQRISDQAGLIEISTDGYDEVLVYYANTNLSHLVDGSRFVVSPTVIVSGTKTYATAIGGTKTVAVIEPFDFSTYVAEEEARRRQAGQRKWTSADGGFTAEASFVGLADGKATIRKVDGTEVAVPLNKLSKADQDYVRKEIAKAKTKD